MIDRVLCIDLGSAYTKVSLRPATSCDVDMLSFPSQAIQFDHPAIVPSAIAVTTRDGRRLYEFGGAAMGRKGEKSKGIEIKQNWKKDLFDLTETPAPLPSGWDALLTSPEFVSLANRYQITAQDTTNLRQLIRQAQVFAGIPPLPPISTPPQSDQASELLTLATEYFRWLFKLVGEAIVAHPEWKITRPSAIPIRIAVPALATERTLFELPGCKILREAVVAAGWTMDSKRPFVSEPLANVVGIVTRGHNILQNDRPELQQMLKRSPLAAAIRNPEVLYRVLAVDIGAFTTDCALICSNPGSGEEGQTVQERLIPQTASDRIGIRQLQEKLHDPNDDDSMLGENQTLAARELSFREMVRRYGQKAMGQKESARITRINGIVDEFVQRVSDFAVKQLKTFLKVEEKARPAKQREVRCDLALTGGGCYIPVVTSVLRKALKKAGFNPINTYMPSLSVPEVEISETSTDKRSHTHYVGTQLSRGSTAVGGVSIFFG